MPVKVNIDQLVTLLHKKHFLPDAIAEIVATILQSGTIEETEE